MKKGYVRQLFVFGLFFLFLGSNLSGCVDLKPFEPEQALYSFSSPLLNQTLTDTRTWIYHQSVNQSETYILDTSDSSSFLDTVENLSFQVLISRLAQTNNSFLEVHEASLEDLLAQMDNNNSTVASISDMVSSLFILEIIVSSPLYDAYKEDARRIYSNLIDAYPYTTVFSSYQQDEEVVLYHFSMAKLSRCLLLYAEKTQNQTSFRIANKILQNATVLIEDMSTNTLSLISSSFYVPMYETMDMLTNLSVYDSSILQIAEHLVAYQNTDAGQIGSFRELTNETTRFPEVFLESVFSDAIATAYEVSSMQDNSSNSTQSFLQSLVLSGYHLSQLQCSLTKSTDVTGGFPQNDNETTPSMLTTVNVFSFFTHLQSVLVDQEPYVFVYDANAKALYETHPEKQEPTSALWIALTLGTVFSIMLIGMVFLILRIKRKKQK